MYAKYITFYKYYDLYNCFKSFARLLIIFFYVCMCWCGIVIVILLFIASLLSVFFFPILLLFFFFSSPLTPSPLPFFRTRARAARLPFQSIERMQNVCKIPNWRDISDFCITRTAFCAHLREFARIFAYVLLCRIPRKELFFHPWKASKCVYTAFFMEFCIQNCMQKMEFLPRRCGRAFGRACTRVRARKSISHLEIKFEFIQYWKRVEITVGRTYSLKLLKRVVCVKLWSSPLRVIIMA